jgi:hypothetical protein
VDANFNAWLAQQEKRFTEEQLHWLEMIRDHIAGNLSIETDEFLPAQAECLQAGNMPLFRRRAGLEKCISYLGMS